MTDLKAIQSLKELAAAIDLDLHKTLSSEKNRGSGFEDIPLAHQMIVLTSALRTQIHFEAEIAPTMERIKACSDRKTVIITQAAPDENGKVLLSPSDAFLLMDKNAQVEKALRNCPDYQRAWNQWKLLREGWRAEGISEAESKAAYGAVCGRFLRYAEGIELKKNGYVDSKTVTAQHLRAAAEDLQAEIDAQSHRNGEGGDTCSEFILEDDNPEIGDNLSAAADNLLKAEFAAMDELAANQKAAKKKGRMTIRKKVSA